MGPEPKWIKEEQAPVDWNGNPKPSTTYSDEWWYAHTKIYNAGVHVGYAACGYSTWSDAVVSLSDQDSCYSYIDTITLNSPSCKGFETNSEIRGALFQTIARYDLDGNMLWYKRFNNESFNKVIQDSDENIIAIGLTTSVKFYTKKETTLSSLPLL